MKNICSVKFYKTSLLILFVLSINYSSISAITVTTTAGLISVLNGALPSGDVVIFFNSPTGTLKITSPLPVITATNFSSLTFKKDPNATMEQGIEGNFATIQSNPAFSIIQSSNPKNINFENLTFRSLGSYPSGVNIQGTNDIKFTNCLFTGVTNTTFGSNNHVDLNATGNATFTVSGCTFNGDLSTTNYSFLKVNSGKADINNSTFDRLAYSTASTSPGSEITSDAGLVIRNNIYKGHSTIAMKIDLKQMISVKEIYDNIFEENTTGLEINRQYQDPNNSSNIFTSIHNNRFVNNDVGLLVSNPKLAPLFSIEANTFDLNVIDIKAETRAVVPALAPNDDSQLDLIGDGTALDNQFVAHSGTSPSLYFNASGTHNLNPKCFKLDLKGEVKCEGNKVNANIQNCNIISNATTKRPIYLLSNANGSTSKPIINSAVLNGGLLYVNFTINNLSTSLKYRVDFYRSNLNGDLTMFLGNSKPINPTTGSITQDITLSAKHLVASDFIAATLSSYPGSLSSYGTGPAGYKDLTFVPSCDLNDICSPDDLTCNPGGIHTRLFDCDLLNVWYYYNPDPLHSISNPGPIPPCTEVFCYDFTGFTSPPNVWDAWSLGPFIGIDINKDVANDHIVSYLQTTDHSGPSDLMIGFTPQHQHQAQPLLDIYCCGEFCFDFRIFDDGIPPPSPGLTTFGQFYVFGNNNKSFTFTSSIPVNETTGWVHICAPVSDILPPPGPTGNWYPTPNTNTDPDDWEPTMSSIKEIVFRTDYSSYQAEVSGFDNFCTYPGDGCSIDCDQTVDINPNPTPTNNGIKSVNIWTMPDYPMGCDDPGNPDYSFVFSNNQTFNIPQAQLGQHSLIQVQYEGGLPVTSIVGQGRLYEYGINISTSSTCDPCEPVGCEDCIGSFRPEPDKDYILSAWVRESSAPNSATNFASPYINIDYTGGPSVLNIVAGGPVIEGWQRIYQRFTIPLNATDMTVSLKSYSGNCLFDDVRIFPANGMMKSYVYDPVTMRFVAELDEENYASYFEYDEEGKLTTVKKETERGKMTVRESRSAIHKTN